MSDLLVPHGTEHDEREELRALVSQLAEKLTRRNVHLVSGAGFAFPDAVIKHYLEPVCVGYGGFTEVRTRWAHASAVGINSVHVVIDFQVADPRRPDDGCTFAIPNDAEAVGLRLIAAARAAKQTWEIVTTAAGVPIDLADLGRGSTQSPSDERFRIDEQVAHVRKTTAAEARRTKRAATRAAKRQTTRVAGVEAA